MFNKHLLSMVLLSTGKPGHASASNLTLIFIIALHMLVGLPYLVQHIIHEHFAPESSNLLGR